MEPSRCGKVRVTGRRVAEGARNSAALLKKPKELARPREWGSIGFGGRDKIDNVGCFFSRVVAKLNAA